MQRNEDVFEDEETVAQVDLDEERRDRLRSMTATMEDVAQWMREQDADLLEEHHARGANQGNTPVLTAQTPPSEQTQEGHKTTGLQCDEMPNLSLSPVAGESEGGPVDGDAGLRPSRSWSRRISRSLSQSEHNSTAETTETTSSERHIRRPTLSGVIFQQEDLVSEHLAAALAEKEGSLEITENGDCKSVPLVEELVESGNEISRSDSLDRRLTEVQQFAEAVGDVPAADELRIIDEEDDDGSSDDDDDDVHGHEILILNGAANEVQTTSPRKSTLQSQMSTNSLEGPAARTKNRPQWPRAKLTKRGFLDPLPDQQGPQDYVYKGIHSNPPEIVKRGTQRGNYALLHRKAWLEVSDKYHRYGKNLRLYYRHWESLGFPTNMFFDWLDSKGEAAGQPLPELEECPRSVLDSDTVLYIADPDITQGYAVSFVPDENGRGLVLDVDGDPVCTGEDGWIFVLRDNVMYGAPKVTSVTGNRSKQRFHHSSFFGGKAVAAAGIFITDDEGYLTRFYPHSGHYRPGEAHVQRMLFFLHHHGVGLKTFEMDMQQMLHVAREKDMPKEKTATSGDKSEKRKKVESLYLMPAVLAACFLAHKARFIGEGIFDQIHQIRKSDATSVREALDIIDNGGRWQP